MKKNEFKDRLFDILNDTDLLPIRDIVTEDSKDIFNVYLADGTRFSVRVEQGGIFRRYDPDHGEGQELS